MANIKKPFEVVKKPRGVSLSEREVDFILNITQEGSLSTGIRKILISIGFVDDDDFVKERKDKCIKYIE